MGTGEGREGGHPFCSSGQTVTGLGEAHHIGRAICLPQPLGLNGVETHVMKVTRYVGTMAQPRRHTVNRAGFHTFPGEAAGVAAR